MTFSNTPNASSVDSGNTVGNNPPLTRNVIRKEFVTVALTVFGFTTIASTCITISLSISFPLSNTFVSFSSRVFLSNSPGSPTWMMCARNLNKSPTSTGALKSTSDMFTKSGNVPANVYAFANANSNPRRNKNPPNIRPDKFTCCGCATNKFSCTVCEVKTIFDNFSSNTALEGISFATRDISRIFLTHCLRNTRTSSRMGILSIFLFFFNSICAFTSSKVAFCSSVSVFMSNWFTGVALPVTFDLAANVKSARIKTSPFSFFKSHLTTIEDVPTYATDPCKNVFWSNRNFINCRMLSALAVTAFGGLVAGSLSSMCVNTTFPANESISSRTRPILAVFHGVA
mmetsp:Transcript_7663/g.24014  ORF Transcript_7663/g.24014 Transcript_7663/m.24014 type:complete len:343 (-) Transcript_7663:244-1272(-)